MNSGISINATSAVVFCGGKILATPMKSVDNKSVGLLLREVNKIHNIGDYVGDFTHEASEEIVDNKQVIIYCDRVESIDVLINQLVFIKNELIRNNAND